MTPVLAVYVVLGALAIRWHHFWQLLPLTLVFVGFALMFLCDRGDDIMAVAPIICVLFVLAVLF